MDFKDLYLSPDSFSTIYLLINDCLWNCNKIRISTFHLIQSREKSKTRLPENVRALKDITLMNQTKFLYDLFVFLVELEGVTKTKANHSFS